MTTAIDGIERYNAVSRVLHWTIAALVLFNLATGLLNDAISGVVRVIPVHKATGILILTLTLVRIGWRLTHARPPMPSAVGIIERLVSNTVHFALYALMLAMPVSGWIMSSASPNPISFYGLFEVPKFGVTREDPIRGLSHDGHEVLGWLMLALAGLHIAAALRHHFILKDKVLHRMM